LVALDPARTTSARYGVDGVPTFVLVDGEGTVRDHVVGFLPAVGLKIGSWLEPR
jgi:hypothetical protein